MAKRIIAAVINDLTYDRRMIRICTTLAENGFEVTLIGRQLRDSKPLNEESFQQKRLRCVFNRGFLFYAEYNLKLLWFLLKTPADIINSTDADTLAACGMAAMLKNKIHVHDTHEYFSEVPEVADRPMIKWFWQYMEKVFIKRADAAYTVCQSIADIYSKKYHLPFDVIMNVPPLREHSLQKESNAKKYLIYQGALNKGRGLEAIILSMHQVDCQLKIAGEGDLSEELRTLVKTEKLESKIDFLGMIKPDELDSITINAYIGLNVCENLGLNYYLALSNKGFDYIHAGIPAVTNDFPEYQRLNARFETMILTEAEPEKLTNSINQLLNDRTLYEKLKKNCIIAAQELNWQKESLKLKAIYERFR
jgi:glycosyltransferase involved in cell wall biosynthesis